jgi:hypothetical protein
VLYWLYGYFLYKNPMGKNNKSKQEASIINQRFDYAVFFVIFILMLVGFYLRIYHLSNPSYWIDEGFTIMQERAIELHGYPLLNSGNIEIKDTLLPYILSLVAKISREGHFNFRLVSVIFGTASIYLIYILGKNLFNRHVGIVSSFFITFSYWHIAWSRQIRSYSMLVFLTLTTIIFVTIAEKRNKKVFLWWALLFIVLASFSKSSGILLFIPFAYYLVAKKYYKEAASLFVIFAVLAYFFRYLLINALDLSLVNYFSFYTVGYLWRYFGILLTLALAGFFLVFKEKVPLSKIHFFDLIFVVTAIIFFSFFVYINQFRYLFFITPVLFVYSAYIIDYISQSNWKKIIVCLFLVLLADFYMGKSFSYLPREFYALEYYTPQPNFKLAYKKIKAEKKYGDLLISPYPYMDLIYNGKSDYYIPISYTGRAGDKIKSDLEYYSGTKILADVKAIKKLRSYGNIFLVFDEMANERASESLQKYLKENAQIIFENHDRQQILVYKLSRKNGSQSIMNN